MQDIPGIALDKKYKGELHCNEVMLFALLYRFDEHRARLLRENGAIRTLQAHLLC